MPEARTGNDSGDRRRYVDDDQGTPWVTLLGMGIAGAAAIAALVKIIILSVTGG